MFGTVAESHVTRSTIQRYGKHRRSLCIKPLTMEFYRSVNVLATLWGIEPPYSLEVTKNEGGFMFYTLPTDTPFGMEIVLWLRHRLLMHACSYRSSGQASQRAWFRL